MARYLRSRGAAVLKGCGLAFAAFLVMAAAGPSPTWTISAVQAAQAPNGTLAAESCPAAGTCMAVGSSHGLGGRSLALAELRHGSAWTALPAQDPGDGQGSVLTAVSCESTSACTAVGSYRNSGGTSATLAEAWNGTAWRIQATPNPAGSFGSYLTGVSCVAAGACTAVGYYYSQSFQDGAVAFAESWDGQAWTLQQVPGEGGPPRFLYAVSCASPSACVAVGSYNGPLGSGLPLAEVWNGKSWTAQAPAVPKGGCVELAGVAGTAAPMGRRGELLAKPQSLRRTGPGGNVERDCLGHQAHPGPRRLRQPERGVVHHRHRVHRRGLDGAGLSAHACARGDVERVRLDGAGSRSATGRG